MEWRTLRLLEGSGGFPPREVIRERVNVFKSPSRGLTRKNGLAKFPNNFSCSIFHSEQLAGLWRGRIFSGLKSTRLISRGGQSIQANSSAIFRVLAQLQGAAKLQSSQSAGWPHSGGGGRVPLSVLSYGKTGRRSHCRLKTKSDVRTLGHAPAGEPAKTTAKRPNGRSRYPILKRPALRRLVFHSPGDIASCIQKTVSRRLFRLHYDDRIVT